MLWICLFLWRIFASWQPQKVKWEYFIAKIPVFLRKTVANFIRNKTSLGKIASHFQLSFFVLREKYFSIVCIIIFWKLVGKLMLNLSWDAQ
jgi:hypothetical protein